MELVVALVAGIAVFLVVLGVVGTRPVDIVQARLTQFGTVQANSLEELELQQPVFDRTLRPVIERLSGVAQRLASPSRVSRTAGRLAKAGNPGGLRTIDFLGLKVFVSAVVGAGVFFGMLLLTRNLLFCLLIGASAAGLGFLAPELWLGRRIRRRRYRIVLALPDTLDLLTISVRAGLGFDAALAKVVEKMTGPLADEFRRALAEIRVGKPRREALRDIVDRTDLPALATFVGAIVQAERMGVPIAKVLQVQSEQMRVTRRQLAEETAAKAPIKMLFPLIGCIFPSMFIVILGPAIILIVMQLGRI